MGHWTPTGIEPMDYDDDERIITFVLHIHVKSIIKYTNKHNLGRKGVGTAFHRKNTAYNS